MQKKKSPAAHEENGMGSKIVRPIADYMRVVPEVSAQLLIKTKKFILKEKLHYNPSV